MLEEEDCIQQSLKIIREYLVRAFPGFDVTEDLSDPSICHKFTLTNATNSEQLKLKIGWPRLSDDVETMERLLVHSDVAGKMRDNKYYFW
jgi:hypothetical protein